MNQRLVYIDLIRAYSIFLVTGYHLWRFFLFPKLEFLSYYNVYSIFIKGSWGVLLFFIISGFSMALITYDKVYNSKINWKKYFIKRLYRIIPAYYVAILIWTILILNGVTSKPIAFVDQITHLLFIHTFFPSTFYSISGVFWTLGIEMQFYFILPLILFFIIKRPIVSLIILGLPICYQIFINQNIPVNSALIFCLFYFILGYIIYIYKNKLYNIFFNNKYKNIILVFFLFIFLNLTFLKEDIINIELNKILWTLIFIPIFIYLSKNEYIQESKNRFLSVIVFTGTSSYSIYLYNYIFYMDKKPFEYSFFAVIYYFFLIYVIGILMYFIVEGPFQVMRKKYLIKKRSNF